MSKIKIGFEITDLWNKQDYRDVIMALQNTPEKIDKRLTAGDVELFLISKDDSSAYIWRTGVVIGLDTDHTIVVSTDAQKLAAIETNEVQLYLDNDNIIIMAVDEDSEYADGILVDSKRDYYTINAKWYSQLVGLIKRLLDDLES